MPPPPQFLVAESDTEMLAHFQLLSPRVDLSLVATLLPALPDTSGCYLWLMRIGQERYKIYVGRTRSVRKRLKDYGLAFQMQSPNDFKLQLFQLFMADTWHDAELELYFVECPEADLKERERMLINSLHPLINNLRVPSPEERRSAQQAFTSYYNNALNELLNGA
jgi:hypothetical protein